jgi:hypothetical protein
VPALRASVAPTLGEKKANVKSAKSFSCLIRYLYEWPGGFSVKQLTFFGRKNLRRRNLDV